MLDNPIRNKVALRSMDLPTSFSLKSGNGRLVIKKPGQAGFFTIDKRFYFNLKAFFTASTALSSSQGNNFTFTVFSLSLPLLYVFVFTSVLRPMCP